MNITRKFNSISDAQPSLSHIFHFRFSLPYVKNKTVLDIGCWSGQLEMLLENHTKKIIGIDPSSKAVSFARKNVKKASFIVGSVEKLPFSSNSFDRILFFQVMEHIEKGTETKALREISRVLKPGGLLLISVPNKHIFSILTDPAYFLIGHRHYSFKEVQKLLQGNGLAPKHYTIRGGWLEAMHNNIDVLLKHTVNKQVSLPDYIKKLILDEFKKEKFWGLYIVAMKNKK